MHQKRIYHSTNPRNSTAYSPVPSTGTLPRNYIYVYKHPLSWRLAGCVFKNFVFLWASRKHTAMYEAGKERELPPPPGKRQILEPSTGKSSARFSLHESRELNQNIQSHMKLDFIHSSTCATACFNFFTHLRQSLETLQVYSVNQHLLDHITESLEPARLFSTKAL